MKDDTSAFIEALTSCQDALRGYCYAKVALWADAEDVMQSTNIKLWEKEAEWDRARPFLPWALGVAHYIILSHYRDQSRDRLIFEEDVMAAMEAHLLQNAEKTPELIIALRQCISRIADEPKEILHSHYIAGWSLGEIARTTSRSVSGLKSLLLRLRRDLSLCINKELQQ